MKKISVIALLSVFFVASPVLAMCPSCRPMVTYVSGARPAYTPAPAPAPVPTPVIVESAAAVKSVNSRIITVNSEEHFKAPTSTGNVIVKFGASWCKPCDRLTAELEKIAEKYNQVKVVYVDTEKQEGLTFQNNISSLPTMHFYKNGVQVSAPVMGLKTEAEIKNMIKNSFGL